MNDLEQTLYAQKRIYHQPIVSYFYKKRLHQLFRWAGLQPDMQVLDIGFENGIFLYHLAQHVSPKNLTGIEREPDIVRRTQAFFQGSPLSAIQLLTGCLLAYDFEGMQYDRIFATSVLEHIKHIEAVGPRIHNLLKPQGRFIVLSPNEHWFYECLRKCFGYQKPADHYHLAHDITRILSQHLKLVYSTAYPPVGRLYKIDIFERKSAHDI